MDRTEIDPAGAATPARAGTVGLLDSADLTTEPAARATIADTLGRRRRKRGYPKVTARVTTPDGFRTIIVTGQTARALLALVEAGSKGCTALELSSWALRLAAYTHTLRHDHGLSITTEHEGHDGGWHGRHSLLDHVTVIAIEEG